MASTELRRFIRAPRATVYRALLDPTAVAKWRLPDGMTCQVETFEPREGGTKLAALVEGA